MEDKPEKAGQRSRTKTGCITCRIRRVKCDETKPSCRKCEQSKRICDGYLPTPPQSHTPPSGYNANARKPLSRRALALAVQRLNAPGPSARLLAPSPYLGDDVACFDFFRFRLSTAIGNPAAASLTLRGFWNSTLLQASHAEPAVWQAVAALGALYRRWEVVSSASVNDSPSPQTEATREDDADASGSSSTHGEDESTLGKSLNEQSLRLAHQAGSCYTRALGLAKSVHDPSSMLVLSIALAATANLSGKWADSAVHYQAGQRIMSHLREQVPDRPMTDFQVNAAESLAKMGLQLLSFQESTLPLLSHMKEFNVNASEAPFPRSLVSVQDQRAWGLQRANVQLVNIIRRILFEASLHNPMDQPVPLHHTNLEIQHAVAHDLATWERETLYLLTHTPSPSSAHRTTRDVLALKLLHTIARLFLAVAVITPGDYKELAWDACLGHMERVVALAALIVREEVALNPLLLSVMSLDEPAINMALWLAALRCRHPVVRRAALELLRGVRRLEGVWMSTSAAVAAAEIIEIEENGEEQQAVGSSDRRRSSNRPARWPPGGKSWAKVQAEWTERIEAEGVSWLGADGDGNDAADSPWASPVSSWDVPGDVFVPLRRRITQVDVVGEYDANIGKSRGVLELIFAGKGDEGELRRKTVSVYF